MVALKTKDSNFYTHVLRTLNRSLRRSSDCRRSLRRQECLMWKLRASATKPCWIFMKFGTDVLYKDLSRKHGFCENIGAS